MIRLYTARARFDAWLVADRLNQVGIKAHVFNQHAQSIVGDIPPEVAQPQVWLEREQDRERAAGAARADRGRGAAQRQRALRALRRGIAGDLRPVLELRGARRVGDPAASASVRR